MARRIDGIPANVQPDTLLCDFTKKVTHRVGAMKDPGNRRPDAVQQQCGSDAGVILTELSNEN